jgi:hypothetical protein
MRWRCDAPPPGGFAHIAAVSLVDTEGREPTHLTMSDAIAAAVDLVVTQSTSDLQVSVDLLDQYGNPILVSTPQDDDVAPPTVAGSYRLHLRFPPEIWLKNAYGLRANVYSPYAGTGHSSAVLPFDVAEAQTFAAKAMNGVDRLGQVALRCSWSLAPA